MHHLSLAVTVSLSPLQCRLSSALVYCLGLNSVHCLRRGRAGHPFFFLHLSWHLSVFNMRGSCISFKSSFVNVITVTEKSGSSVSAGGLSSKHPSIFILERISWSSHNPFISPIRFRRTTFFQVTQHVPFSSSDFETCFCKKRGCPCLFRDWHVLGQCFWKTLI